MYVYWAMEVVDKCRGRVLRYCVDVSSIETASRGKHSTHLRVALQLMQLCSSSPADRCRCPSVTIPSLPTSGLTLKVGSRRDCSKAHDSLRSSAPSAHDGVVTVDEGFIASKNLLKADKRQEQVNDVFWETVRTWRSSIVGSNAYAPFIRLNLFRIPFRSSSSP